MTKRWHTAHQLIVIIVSVTLGLVWTLLANRPYLSYPELPLKVTAKQVRAGQAIPLRVARMSTSDGIEEYTISRGIKNLDNGAFTILKATKVPVPQGYSEGPSSAHILPLETPPGRSKLVGTARIQGWLRVFLVPFESEEFEVLPPCVDATSCLGG